MFVAWSFDHGRHRLTLFAGAFQKGFITAPPDDGSGYRIGYIKNQRFSGYPKIRSLKEPSVGCYCLHSFIPVPFEPPSLFMTLLQIGHFTLCV